MVLDLNTFVGRHIDHSLRSYCEKISFPKLVSVLYVNAPNMDGGDLILSNKKNKLIGKITPEYNKFICFNGKLKHEISKIEDIISNNKERRISLVCEQYSVKEKYINKIPDFTIRSTALFSDYLDMEK